MSKILRSKVQQAPLLGRALMALVLVLSSVVVVGLGSQALALPDQEATLSFDPQASKVYRGDEVTVAIRVNEVEALWGYQFTLTFNPNVVTVTDVEDAGFLGTGIELFGPEYEDGQVTFGASYLEPPTAPPNGPGVLATVTLRGDELGRSPLALEDPQLFPGGELEVPQAERGVVDSVLEIEVSPASAEEWVNPGVFVEEIMIHGARNLAGFAFDLGFDPAVVQVDSVVLGPFLGSTGRTPGTPFEVIDNVNGMLTFEDFSTGTMDGPSGSGVLATVTFTALAKGDTALDLEGLRVFDPDANEENPDDADGILHVVEQGVQVTPLEQSVNRCDTFDVWVWVADANDLAGFKFDLAWDETLFTVDNIEAYEDFLTQNGRTIDFVLEEIDNDNGTLNFEVATVGAVGTGVDGLGPMAHLTVTAIGVGTSDLVLSDTYLYDSEAVEERPTLTNGAATATKEAVRFEFDPISSPQVAGHPFDVTITALNEDDLPAVNFSGWVDLSDTTGTLSPTEVEFEGPVATASMMITKAQTGITISAETVNPCGVTITGESNAFDIEPDRENPASVTIAPPAVTLDAGECQLFTLTGEDTWGNTFDVTADEDTTFAADGGGTMTDNQFCAETVGDWTVTGTYLTVSDDAAVTVEPGPLFEIVVTPDPAPVLVGHQQQFTATGYDAYGNVVAITPTWSLVDADAGSLDAAGLFTASFNIGTYEDAVVATQGAFSGAATVEVTGYQIFMPVIMNNFTP